MDLEGLSKRLLKAGLSDDEIIQKLISEYKIHKKLDESILEKLAIAVLDDSKKSLIPEQSIQDDGILREILITKPSDVTMGSFGVGCRGYGDFFVHKLIASLSKTSINPLLSPEALDDCGAVVISCSKESQIIVSKMEGMHSRLSDFPFLAAFHVTRAALRDLLVKGAKPISIMVDIHLGDDADISKLFDFCSGVAAVAELADVPITAGSTLRIGGDMVIGDRITGGIAAVGIAKKLFARRDIQENDVILMTEGAGGGTISTSAIYTGSFETALETMNIKFLKVAMGIINQKPGIIEKIHCMSDVTNGGLRGDLREISSESKLGARVYEKEIIELVNPKVRDLLNEKNIDYLGVSLDALLIFCKEEIKDEIISIGEKLSVKINEIGKVTKGSDIILVSKDGESDLIPHFREAAYTNIKKAIGEKTPQDVAEMESKILKAYEESLEKRKKVVEFIGKRQELSD